MKMAVRLNSLNSSFTDNVRGALVRLKQLIIFISVMLCFSCKNYNNNLVIQAFKNNVFTELEDTRLTLTNLTFDDWA